MYEYKNIGKNKSMLKVVNKSKPSTKIPIEVGQFYSRYDDPKSVYVISSMFVNDWTHYCAIMLSHGVPYVRPIKDISRVFDGFDEKFYLIDDLTITING